MVNRPRFKARGPNTIRQYRCHRGCFRSAIVIPYSIRFALLHQPIKLSLLRQIILLRCKFFSLRCKVFWLQGEWFCLARITKKTRGDGLTQTHFWSLSYCVLYGFPKTMFARNWSRGAGSEARGNCKRKGLVARNYYSTTCRPKGCWDFRFIITLH